MSYSSCLFESRFGTELILIRIDGAIQVRTNTDPTFYSFVDLGGSGGPMVIHHRSSLLRESIYPLSVYGWIFL
jgi:hypothetical protein